MHACVVSLTPLPLLFRIILQCDDLFLSFCVVLCWTILKVFVCLLLFCFVFTFLLFNLSFIYVCVGFFFSVLRLHHFILCLHYLQKKCWLDGEAASEICLPVSVYVHVMGDLKGETPQF